MRVDSRDIKDELVSAAFRLLLSCARNRFEPNLLRDNYKRACEELDYTDAKTIEEATAWAKENLKIEHVNYSKFDVRIANEINKELWVLKETFPEVMKNIKYLDTIQNLYKYTKKDKEAVPSVVNELMDKYEKLEATKELAVNNELAYKVSKILSEKMIKAAFKTAVSLSRVGAIGYAMTVGKYRGIYFNEKNMRDLDEFKAQSNKVYRRLGMRIFSNHVRDAVNHEFSHHIDYFVQDELSDNFITNCYKFCKGRNRQEKGYIRNEISGYAQARGVEFAAEAIKEYLMADDARKWPRVIGQHISERFEEIRKNGKGQYCET